MNLPFLKRAEGLVFPGHIMPFVVVGWFAYARLHRFGLRDRQFLAATEWLGVSHCNINHILRHRALGNGLLVGGRQPGSRE